MDAVIDADILSTFAKLKRVGLLKKLFHNSQLLMPPAVDREIKEAIRLGYDLDVKYIKKVKLTKEERRVVREWRNSRRFIGLGELECVAIAYKRSLIILSNDRRIKKEARSLNLLYLNLPMLLRMLWKNKVVSKNDIIRLIDEIKSKDKIVIENIDAIFEG